ncbi:hypothetical protein CPB84DRAFT_1749863 [Gymnopilus junonius]|uniref:Uncharacterized protein n=1 Tax=Gymnopilus junonius TaxID=109634 RepID=A0A9P5NF67_GYMJU|nr:hypothetical protein CPB84DRAFT_1749863 [Gymnopilus junonius]
MVKTQVMRRGQGDALITRGDSHDRHIRFGIFVSLVRTCRRAEGRTLEIRNLLQPAKIRSMNIGYPVPLIGKKESQLYQNSELAPRTFAECDFRHKGSYQAIPSSHNPSWLWDSTRLFGSYCGYTSSSGFLKVCQDSLVEKGHRHLKLASHPSFHLLAGARRWSCTTCQPLCMQLVPLPDSNVLEISVRNLLTRKLGSCALDPRPYHGDPITIQFTRIRSRGLMSLRDPRPQVANYWLLEMGG